MKKHFKKILGACALLGGALVFMAATGEWEVTSLEEKRTCEGCHMKAFPQSLEEAHIDKIGHLREQALKASPEQRRLIEELIQKLEISP